MRATISIDLRERILKAYDRGESTREEVAERFSVSLAMVKKLLQQRRQTGDIAPRHSHSGRKPRILESHRRRLRQLLSKKPDMTLEELREAAGLDCTVQAVHYALEKMGLTCKKRRSAPASKDVRMSSGTGSGGGASKRASTRKSSSSLTNRRRKRT